MSCELKEAWTFLTVSVDCSSHCGKIEINMAADYVYQRLSLHASLLLDDMGKEVCEGRRKG